MNLQQIKDALENGKRVYWKSKLYEVIKDSKGQYLIKCVSNDSCIGLTWLDGITLNGQEQDFYTEAEQCETT